jgi:3-oxoadipate enol-lactonase
VHFKVVDVTNDFERGLHNRRRVLGDDWVEKSLANANELTAEFQTQITRIAWNDVWGRSHAGSLDDKTRRMLVLGMTLGLGRFEEFTLHVRAGLVATDASALSLNEIKELIQQAAVYCGVPAANTAVHAVSAVVKELKMTPPALHVVSSGAVTSNRPVLVMSHGLGLDLTMWDDIVPALEHDFTIIRYDHRGHGQSAQTPLAFSIDTLVDDAAAVILREVFAHGGGPVHFLGLSMGGMVAQGLAARYPHLVRTIIIANSASFYDEVAQASWANRIGLVEKNGIDAIIDVALSRWFIDDVRASQPDLIARVTSTLRTTDAMAYVRAARAVAGIDFRASNPRIKCPSLIIAGTQDRATPPALSEAMNQTIAGSKLQYIEAGHLSCMQTPDAFVDLCATFLKDV